MEGGFLLKNTENILKVVKIYRDQTFEIVDRTLKICKETMSSFEKCKIK